MPSGGHNFFCGDSIDDHHQNYLKTGPESIIAVSSGKGGTGKTLTIINMAFSLSKMGKKVLIFDGDLGMSNVDVILGLKSEFQKDNFLDENQKFSDFIIKAPGGIDVVPSGSGIFSFQKLSFIKKEIIREHLIEASKNYDILLIDTGSGINENVMYLNSIANTRVIVTTTDPHALTDAYAMVKVLAKNFGIMASSLLINMVTSPSEADKIAERFLKTVKTYVKAEVNFLGFVPEDKNLRRAVKQRNINPDYSLNTLWGQAWHKIAYDLLKNLPEKSCGTKSISDVFWSAAFSFSDNKYYPDILD